MSDPQCNSGMLLGEICENKDGEKINILKARKDVFFSFFYNISTPWRQLQTSTNFHTKFFATFWTYKVANLSYWN